MKKRTLANSGAVNPDATDKIEWKLTKDTSFHKRTLFDLMQLFETPGVDDEAKNAILSLIDTVKYSDPRSIPESEFYEELISDNLRKLKEAGSFNVDDIQFIVKHMNSRNSSLKLWK